MDIQGLDIPVMDGRTSIKRMDHSEARAIKGTENRALGEGGRGSDGSGKVERRSAEDI